MSFTVTANDSVVIDDGISVRIDHDLPNVNEYLLRRCVAWALADAKVISDWSERLWGVKPEESWGQEMWAKEWRNGRCQTAYCIAGQAAVSSGYMFPLRGENLDPTYDNREDACQHSLVYPRVRIGHDRNGQAVYAPNLDAPALEPSEVGAQALGLSPHEARLLFDGSNEAFDIWAIATVICARRGVDLDLPRPDSEGRLTLPEVAEYFG